MAYGRTAGLFLRCCEDSGIGDLGALQPVHVATYIEQLQAERSAPTIKQHLGCIRMLFGWLVTGQVIPTNPPHSVRRPRHSVSNGVTVVISSVEARELLNSMEPRPLSVCAIAHRRRQGLYLRPGERQWLA